MHGCWLRHLVILLLLPQKLPYITPIHIVGYAKNCLPLLRIDTNLLFMKKVVLGLALCLAFSSAFAQSAILYDYVGGDSFGYGAIADEQIRVYSVLETNIATGKKDGYLALVLYSTSHTKLGEGRFCLDEIPAVLEMLSYAQDNLVDTKPKTEPRLDLISGDGCKLSVWYNKSGRGSWQISCKPHDSEPGGVSGIPVTFIPKLLTNIKESEERIKEHLSTN